MEVVQQPCQGELSPNPESRSSTTTPNGPMMEQGRNLKKRPASCRPGSQSRWPETLIAFEHFDLKGVLKKFPLICCPKMNYCVTSAS